MSGADEPNASEGDNGLLNAVVGSVEPIRRAQVKVGLINLCKGIFSLNALIYYKLKSGT
jgi:hypothetical protein